MPNTVRRSLATAGREKTAALWGKALEKYADDPEVGSLYFEDFHMPFANPGDAAVATAVGWFVQDAAAGGTAESFTNSASPDGKAVLSATTGTDHFGIEAHRGSTATSLGSVNLPTHSTDARGEVIFEAKVDLSSSDNYFVGLTEPIVEFLSATGTLPTDSDYIGFYRADAGDLTFVCANDNNGGTAVTDSATILAAADIPTGEFKLGFKVDRDSKVHIFVDGTYYKTESESILSTALPIESLTQKIASTRGATADLASVSVTIDWVATFVERA